MKDKRKIDIHMIYHKGFGINHQGSNFNINESEEGETMEEKVARIMTTKEPITDSAPPIFSEKSEGVIPEYDVRTDRFDQALDAIDTLHRTAEAKKMEYEKALEQKNDGKTEPVQGTEQTK